MSVAAGGRWDLVVAGAGPAGCATALGLLRQRPEARVLLLDRDTFPRDKVCGDGVAPQTFDVLGDLGLDVERLVDGYRPVDRLMIRSATGVVADRRMRAAYVVPREVLDHRLVEQTVERGAVLRRHRVRHVGRDGSDVVVDGRIRARVVVGADGAGSAVRRSVGTLRRPAMAVAIRGYSPVAPEDADRQLITMAGGRWPSYAWSFPIGDGTANVGYGELVGATPTTRGRLLERMHDLLPPSSPVRLRAYLLPLTGHRAAVPDGPVLLAGDALSLVNAMTGEGIFYAVLSGALAGAAAVHGEGAGSAYRHELHRLLGRHFRHTAALSRVGSWSWLVDRGVRAARDDQRVFDDLVRLGLADGTVTARLARSLLRVRR